jgi:hypothetical protein
MFHTSQNPKSLFACSVFASAKLFCNENNWTTNMYVRKHLIEATLPKHLVKLVWKKTCFFKINWIHKRTFPQITDESYKCSWCNHEEAHTFIFYCCCFSCHCHCTFLWSEERYKYWMPKGKADLKNPIEAYKQWSLLEKKK